MSSRNNFNSFDTDIESQKHLLEPTSSYETDVESHNDEKLANEFSSTNLNNTNILSHQRQICRLKNTKKIVILTIASFALLSLLSLFVVPSRCTQQQQIQSPHVAEQVDRYSITLNVTSTIDNSASSLENEESKYELAGGINTSYNDFDFKYKLAESPENNVYNDNDDFAKNENVEQETLINNEEKVNRNSNSNSVYNDHNDY